MIRNYQVFLTPIIYENVYKPSEIDITDRVVNISQITQEVDAGDYDVGVFVYGDISLKVTNYDGYFSNENDPRSIFVHSRDLSKIRIVYQDSVGNLLTFFRGLISEEGSRQDDQKDEVTFRVLALDSVFRKVKTRTGMVLSKADAYENFRRLLTSDTKITSVLNYNPAKINPKVNTVVDDASFFDEKPLRESIDALLIGCNSVLQIDDVGDMVVRSRKENNNIAWEFYNFSDGLDRENIIKTTEVNNGLQRVFNSVIVRGKEKEQNGNFTDPRYVKYFNLRSKTIELGYMTDEFKMRPIARSIAEEFAMPRFELEITVATEAAKDIKMLDKVRVFADYKYNKPDDETFLPLFNIHRFGQVRFPFTQGNSFIDSNVKWKVIGIEHDVKKLETVLKLRQAGEVNFEGWE